MWLAELPECSDCRPGKRDRNGRVFLSLFSNNASAPVPRYGKHGGGDYFTRGKVPRCSRPSISASYRAVVQRGRSSIRARTAGAAASGPGTTFPKPGCEKGPGSRRFMGRRNLFSACRRVCFPSLERPVERLNDPPWTYTSSAFHSHKEIKIKAKEAEALESQSRPLPITVPE